MTDSPFLPNSNIQFAWDSTSIGYLKLCPRLYYYTMIEGWTSREDSVHLRFGSEYHHALQDYDKSRAAGITHDDAVFDVVRELLFRTWEKPFDHAKKTRDSLVRTVIWYLDKHKDDPGKTYIKADGEPAVELSFRWPLEGEGPDPEHEYWLCGHLDKVVDWNDALYVKDYKTVYTFWGKHWEPDNQMTLYSLAAQVVLAQPIRGVIIDMAQVKEETTDFKREMTYRTKDQLMEWLDDLRYWFALAKSYADANHWPMNDMSCDKYGGCRFRSICSKSPQVRKQFLDAEFIKQSPEEKWNPLKSR